MTPITPRVQLLINCKRFHQEALEREGVLAGRWRGPIIWALSRRIKKALHPKKKKGIQVDIDFEGRKEKARQNRRKKKLKIKKLKRKNR
jgi:hypothetical protein